MPVNTKEHIILLTLYFSALFSGCRSEQETLWQKIEVNEKQAECLSKYIERLETPDESGYRVDVNERNMHVIKSDVLESLFEGYVFVYVPYEERIREDEKHLRSRTIGLYKTIALDESGSKMYIFPGYGNYEQFADFLRDRGTKVNSMEDAKEIWQAFCQIHKKGGQGDFVKVDRNRWKLARHSTDFRSVSDSEEIREEY
jgi:hypothetical protein